MRLVGNVGLGWGPMPPATLMMDTPPAPKSRRNSDAEEQESKALCPKCSQLGDENENEESNDAPPSASTSKEEEEDDKDQDHEDPEEEDLHTAFIPLPSPSRKGLFRRFMKNKDKNHHHHLCSKCGTHFSRSP